MLRQCAWCLRLIDGMGKRISNVPLPKLYEASHGMCNICGVLWMKQVLEEPLETEERAQGSAEGTVGTSEKARQEVSLATGADALLR
ncbi:hypothetical protein EPA93_28505 [Ktedonosporobacter rubrisoli]|uniref:Uncharacterized protein n=1 Tax=Ktedonosporobacter rubrisoli TaxID=2509675 RepID=A0A4P6JXF5_KTERU|nr:hypothetical protein [Ktedonosporobacter rubrisoli]QBD79706.1 hypothetical protein EPA93_28505 [Ktedonosporobacter rubrisoli]